MSTFMFKYKNSEFTPVSNIFIDKFMSKARGEYIKVYLLGLRYCLSGELGANSFSLASTLNLLESDIMNAWNYWNEEGVIKITEIDSSGNYSIEFLDLNSTLEEPKEDINLLSELKNTSIKDMMEDIEKLLGRPLSSKEITLYLSWQKDFNFSPELILLLIQYSASKGKTDYRYMERIAISWHDAKIKNIDEAQTFIKGREDKWLNMKKVLKYLGIQNMDIMKPQEQMIEKWLDIYNFPLEMIYKACDICFERINKCDFKYIDGILNSWFRNNIQTLKDVETKSKTKPKSGFNKNSNYINYNNNSSSNTFTNRKQGSYNIDEIERKLLGWDNND